VIAALGIGTLPAWLTVAGVLTAAWVFYRGGGGTALHTLSEANRVLERRVRDLEEQVKRDAATIAQLTAKTDIAVALEPLISWTREHEVHDREQFERILNVLDLIASRLAPEDNGKPLREDP
jgi:hypothetical protein